MCLGCSQCGIWAAWFLLRVNWLSEEAWYYMPKGHLLRLENSTSEAQTLRADQEMDDDLAKILEENNLLQAGTLPAAHAATEAGEKALLALFDDPAGIQKRATKQKKENKEEAEEMKPKTLKELLDCMGSRIQHRCCMWYLWLIVDCSKASGGKGNRDPEGFHGGSQNLHHPDQAELRRPAIGAAAQILEADGDGLQENVPAGQRRKHKSREENYEVGGSEEALVQASPGTMMLLDANLHVDAWIRCLHASSSKRPAVWIEIQKEGSKEGSRQEFRESGVMRLEDALHSA